MSGFSQLPVYKIYRSSSSRVSTTESDRIYNVHRVDMDMDKDVSGCKSLQEYALKKLFEDDRVHAPLEQITSTEMAVNAHDFTPRITLHSPTIVQKKRRAPDPPVSLLKSQIKFSSIDDLLLDRKFMTAASRNVSQHPLSVSSNRLNTDFWGELLLGKPNSKSPSPDASPKLNRTKNILRKLKSPMAGRRHSRKGKRVISKEDEEEAGFIPSSNGSSFDEPGGFTATKDTVFFAAIPFDLEKDVDFQVQHISDYDKYLYELLQETDPDHQYYEYLKQAAAQVRSIVKDREDELGNMDNQRPVKRVQDKFPYDDLQLNDINLKRKQLMSRCKSAPGAVLLRTMRKAKSTNNILSHTSLGKKDTEYFHQLQQYNNFNRQFLMEGIVEFSRSMQTQDRYLFLFTDLLLVAKQKSNTTFKLKYRVRVAELWISDCVDDVTERTCFKDRSFVIGWPTTNYVATFKSPELKETWLNKLKEQIMEERSKFLSKMLPLEVRYTETDQTCKVEVEITTDVLSVVKECLERLNINESNCRDYQLWVRVGPNESPYPLCGHELPYAIEMSHLRDYCKQPYNNNMSDVEIQQMINEIQSNNRKNEFFLKFKKSQKQHCLDHPKPKSKKISPLINIFRKYRKKPQGKLFSLPLADVTSADMFIAKPVKELLTILFQNGPDTAGILRKSCNAKKCRELKQKLDDGEDCLMSENCPALVIGALFKDYLRSIPQSLLKEELFDDWLKAINITDQVEKFNKFKDTVSKLPAPHYELLRHLMCVLYHIDKNSKENKMTAYNLSLCIAPSLLWQKGNQDPLATPPEIIQYMIENCAQIFGEDSIHLFGDRVEHKMRQDSSTDSDSMHHILSSQSNLQRDNASLDSLEREFYSGEIDYSPNLVKSQHFSPSNLSGDSGLISDSQFYDEDANEMIKDKNFICSISHVMQNNENRNEELEQENRGSHAQYYSANSPVPPPRRPRRKTSISNNVSPIEDTQKLNKYTSQDNFIIKTKYESCSNLMEDRHKRTSELLKSVEERCVTASESNITGCIESSIGTLRKSASGSYLYFEEMNAPKSYELQNLKALSRCRNLYKVASEGAMLISPQSKNSLSSSHDSVLSDSSELYLNRQNSSDQNSSSSANTPEREECSMSQWLNQHSYNLPRQTQVSHDDIDGLIMDKKPINKMNYLVSPKTSPKVLRHSPITLCGRSLPLHIESPIKGNGSHSFNAAEETIKASDFSVTLHLQDSFDSKSDCHNNNENTPSPHLDVYNNNAQIAMKQLNIYSSGGLQGVSPCPHIVLHGRSSQSQTQRRDHFPLKGNHNILNTVQRCSLDSAEFTERRQKYSMEENSISSEDENTESDSKHESFHVMTMINVSLKFDIPQKVIVDPKCSSSETLSRSSNQCDDGSVRQENPPGYAEAVHRTKLLKQGASPGKLEVDPETLKQREASVKAKQLYEQSMIQYEEQKERCPLPSQKCEPKLDAHEKQNIQDTSNSSHEEEEAECNARRLYEESLTCYNEQQQGRSPLHKAVSEDKNSVSVSNDGDTCISKKFICQSISDLNPSHNDLANIKEKPRSISYVNSFNNRNSTPNQQPNQPPPYNDPPPYHCEHADCTESSLISAKRHIFSRAGVSAFKQASKNNSPQMVNKPALGTTSPLAVSKLSQKNKSQNVCISCQNTLSPEAMNDSTLKALPAEPTTAFELTSDCQILNNAQPVSVYKQRVGVSVSKRMGNIGVVSVNNDDYSNENITHSSKPDNTIKSTQSKIGKCRLQVPNVSTRVDLTNNKVKSVGTHSSQSTSDVFKPHTALIKQKAYPIDTIHPQASSQGPINSRNPDISKSFCEVDKSPNIPTSNLKARRSSLDAAIGQHASVAQKELPWSVKQLSNIFDTSETSEVSRSQLNSCSRTVAAKLLGSSSSSPHLPSSCTPPLPFQRNAISVPSRTSNCSNIRKS